MAASNNTITTTLKEMETYQKVWIIHNAAPVFDKLELLNGQKFVLETKEAASSTCTWQIGLEAGNTGDRCAYIYCQLCEIKNNAETPITATFECETRRVSDGARYGPYRIDDTFLKNKRVQVEAFHASWKSSILESDGSIKLYVRLSVPSNLITPQTAQPNHTLKDLSIRSTNILQENLNKLLSDMEISDLKIVTSDGMELHGHRLILQMQNPVFKSMLRSDLSESKTGVISVTDVCGKTMKIILRYLYTQELSENWSDVDIIVEFVYAAGKYQLTEVLKMIDDTLGSEMTEEYSSCIIPLLSLTSKLSLKKAEMRLMEQFVQHAAKKKTGEELLAMVQTQTNDMSTQCRKTLDGE